MYIEGVEDLVYQDYILLAIVIAGVIYILVTRKWFLKQSDEDRRKSGGEEPVDRIEGYAVTWIDPHGDFPNVPWHRNLMIVKCDCFVYADGRVESIKSTYDKGYYDGEVARKVNPYIDGSLLEEYGQQNENGQIIWADGTDRGRNIFDAPIPVLAEQQSKGTTKANVKHTMEGIAKRSGS